MKFWVWLKTRQTTCLVSWAISAWNVVFSLLSAFFAITAMLRAEAVQKWPQVRQADSYESKVFGARRYQCLKFHTNLFYASKSVIFRDHVQN